eukprot:849052-Prorocentrum_minimum.AAC.1
MKEEEEEEEEEANKDEEGDGETDSERRGRGVVSTSQAEACTPPSRSRRVPERRLKERPSQSAALQQLQAARGGGCKPPLMQRRFRSCTHVRKS